MRDFGKTVALFAANELSGEGSSWFEWLATNNSCDVWRRLFPGAFVAIQRGQHLPLPLSLHLPLPLSLVPSRSVRNCNLCFALSAVPLLFIAISLLCNANLTLVKHQTNYLSALRHLVCCSDGYAAFRSKLSPCSRSKEGAG